MAAQTASSAASFGFLSQRQQPSGLISPSDATVFFCASDISTATTQNNKLNLFTRAHSLEIPDDNDLPMVDMDLELPDDTENLWLPEPLMEFDISTSNLDLGSVSSIVFNCEVTPTRQPKTKRSKRITTKQKIDALRNEVERLALQLQEMEKTGKEREAKNLVQPMTCKLWKKIAQRQLSQRQSSEEENAKLRQMMGMQVREARNLRQMLTRRPKLEVLAHTVREQCPEIEFPRKR
ncbi:hypothetical protein DVH05_027487 [Phytophthora capsici]|nr:hypothetical protein DVH05_003105 [Phytophthora capsici]KAG1690885.1 hypothetical protein DVH05_027487 [Phytophthora capsici]